MKESEECQICLTSKDFLLYASCNHGACTDCFNTILFSKNNRLETLYSPSTIEIEADDEDELAGALLHCSGYARCPFCRKVINMFEIKTKENHVHSTSNNDCNSQQFYATRINIWETEIAGLQLQDKKRTMRIQFPSEEDVPKICFYHNLNGTESETAIPFQAQEYHYHEHFKTFRGKIDTSTLGWLNYRGNWEFIMEFSSDLRYVTHGVILKRPFNEFSNSECRLNDYPLAGKWIVRWQLADQKGVDRNDLQAAQIIVYGNRYSYLGFTYDINLGDEKESQVHFKWHNNVIQVAESGINLKTQKDGPNVGETIVWKVTDSRYFRIFWTRETKELLRLPIRIDKLGLDKTLFRKIEQTKQREKPTYHPGSPWKNTFMQGATVGMASYHFISPDGDGEEGAYISYEHIQCSNWPNLDNGQPVPSRAPFKDISYDADTRTFRGVIPWLERFGATWTGSAEWQYEIVFDSEFLCIQSGGVKSTLADGSQSESFNHKYGESLSYVNAGIVHAMKTRFLQAMDSSRVDIDDDNAFRQCLSATISRLRKRLTDEGTSPRTTSEVLRLTLAGITENEDELEIDYNV